MHTRVMNVTTHPNGKAPSCRDYKLGGKGGATALAWQHVWDRLSRTEFRDGHVLAEEASRAMVDARVLPDSIRAQMYAAVRDGYLETEQQLVETTAFRDNQLFPVRRRRSFYRIKEQA